MLLIWGGGAFAVQIDALFHAEPWTRRDGGRSNDGRMRC